MSVRHFISESSTATQTGQTPGFEHFLLSSCDLSSTISLCTPMETKHVYT